MAGVEAAASLFGSEDSGSDLFATLGANTSPIPPAPPEADFFNTTSTEPEAGVVDNIYREQHAHEHSGFSTQGQIGVSSGQQANTSEDWNSSQSSVSETYPGKGSANLECV